MTDNEFIRQLLDPERFGHAVSAEVRDAARVQLGIVPRETQQVCEVKNGEAA